MEAGNNYVFIAVVILFKSNLLKTKNDVSKLSYHPDSSFFKVSKH